MVCKPVNQNNMEKWWEDIGYVLKIPKCSHILYGSQLFTFFSALLVLSFSRGWGGTLSFANLDP